ncbi:MAG TPA: hypothetical protein VNZ85_05805 [Caulobacter sp.]|nr:hypothetical protein [Caulobacter sp.]
MDATTLAIIIAILSPVVPLVIEAMKANGRARIVFAILAGVFVLAALLWIPIAKASPAIAQVAREIVSTPSTWFTVVVVGVVFAHHWWVRRAFLAEQENALFPMGIGAEALEGIEALSRENRELRAAHEALLPEIGKAAGAIPVFEKQLLKLIEAHKASSEQVETQAEEIEALKATIEKLSTGIMAIGHREHLSASGKAVNDMALRLSVEDGADAKALDWDEWWKLEGAFRSKLDNWIMLARFYDDQVGEKIYAVSEDTYLDVHWTLRREAFPSHDAMVRYRTFRTIYGKWVVQDETIRHATSKLAFGY